MDNLLLELVKNGCFGNIKFISYSINSENAAQHYSSQIKFATINYEKNKKEKELYIFIKTQLLDPKQREFRDCDGMFKNEVLMYNFILPKINADKKGLFPHVYYALATEGMNISKDVIVLENLHQNGFQEASDFFLDYEHLSLALKKLALFHSLSFSYKSSNNDFRSLANRLSETWFTYSLPRNIKSQSLAAIYRGIQPLIDQGYNKEILTEFLNSFQPLFEVVEKLKAPEEPFGVICHGDFVQSNICFKYIDNKPIDLRMFDLQSSIYSTPVLDLSKFLYTNTNKLTRDKYWDQLLSVYWNEFTSCLPKTVHHPQYEEFLEHFAKKAVYGYISSSFVVPMMMPTNTVQMEEYSDLSDDEKSKLFMRSGGESATQAVTDIVKHLYEKNYIQKYLERS